MDNRYESRIRRLRSGPVFVSLFVFGIGAWQVYWESKYWPNARGHLPVWKAACLVGEMAVWGAIVGALAGCVFGAIAVLLRRSWKMAFRIGFVLGLNVVGLVALWFMPGFV